ncbi:MAG: HAMP domain-containing histidine kinase [Muribaculaceae bacterium]|nr:HAMP domain-containing histidine kinase [Muribaculaceae bacterium]
MERRIKALYIITIIAILAFLAMQVYWLHGRYEYALEEYERTLSEKIIEGVARYNEIRNNRAYTPQAQDDGGHNHNMETELVRPSFSIYQVHGDTVKTTRTIKIFTHKTNAYDLLGLEPGTPLSDEQKFRAIDIAENMFHSSSDSVEYDATGAQDENEAWASSQNLLLERKHPFAVAGIDSVLNEAGVKALIALERADSLTWRTSVDYRISIFKPEVTVTVPYSQLEGKQVRIVCPVRAAEVLPSISHTFIIVLAVSVLLIVCLVLQFATVLKLTRLDRMRNGFVTTMIHELKRPISTLKMCVSGIENPRMMADEDTKRELVAETRNALDNLSAYFSKLRDITFNNVEQIPLNVQSIPLGDLFDDVVAASSLPADKTVTFINVISPSVIISADRTHLFNILNNLVENAIKYSGPEVEIRAYAEMQNSTVEIRVEDTGCGIPAGDIPNIFKRFYRGQSTAGDRPGMGLGLTYVKLLVDAHGGEIAVESEEGQGSNFIIRFPQ